VELNNFDTPYLVQCTSDAVSDHIVMVVDGTRAVEGNSIQMYVDGVAMDPIMHGGMRHYPDEFHLGFTNPAGGGRWRGYVRDLFVIKGAPDFGWLSRRQRRLAVAMAQHPRLGAGSPLRLLPRALLLRVVAMSERGESRDGRLTPLDVHFERTVSGGGGDWHLRQMGR
jgi:hypothetical protein